jgi:hypothetical protein
MTPTVTLDENALHILRHSLGLTSSRRAYRNHYLAGGQTIAACRALVSQGLMSEGGASVNGQMFWFYVTDDGKRVARSKASGRSQEPGAR